MIPSCWRHVALAALLSAAAAQEHPLERTSEGYLCATWQVQGRRCRVLIDTGSPVSFIDAGLVRRLGVPTRRRGGPECRDFVGRPIPQRDLAGRLPAFRGPASGWSRWIVTPIRVTCRIGSGSAEPFAAILGNDWMRTVGASLDLGGMRLRTR